MISSLATLTPLVIFVLAGSLAIAAFAVLADVVTWTARAKRTEPHAFTGLFRGWHIAIWIATMALHPDFPVRVAGGVIAAEHAFLLLTLAKTRTGRVLASDEV